MGDGSFTTALREALKHNGNFIIYVSGDAANPAIWMESLNTVLDDNKCLVLANKEKIHLNDRVRIVFNVKTCDGFSPATVSRLAWIVKR